MTLIDALLWIAAGPGAGAVTLWLMDAVPWLYYQSARDRRWLSLAIAMVLAMLAQTGAMWLQRTWPGPDPRQWFTAYGNVCTFALVTSQGLHGERLSNKPRPKETP